MNLKHDKHKENIPQASYRKTSGNQRHIENKQQLGVCGGEHITFKGATISLTADLSVEVMESRKQQNKIFNWLKDNNY